MLKKKTVQNCNSNRTYSTLSICNTSLNFAIQIYYYFDKLYILYYYFSTASFIYAYFNLDFLFEFIIPRELVLSSTFKRSPGHITHTTRWQASRK